MSVLGGILMAGPALWQAIGLERNPDEMDTSWWTYAVIIGTVLYITGVVFELL